MSAPQFTTLEAVLLNPESFEWSDALYLPSDRNVWEPRMRALVMDSDDVEGDDDEPRLAHESGFRYILQMATVQDVVANALEQRPGCALTDRMRALRFYLDRDAFIDFSKADQ